MNKKLLLSRAFQFHALPAYVPWNKRVAKMRKRCYDTRWSLFLSTGLATYPVLVPCGNVICSIQFPVQENESNESTYLMSSVNHSDSPVSSLHRPTVEVKRNERDKLLGDLSPKHSGYSTCEMVLYWFLQAVVSLSNAWSIGTMNKTGQDHTHNPSQPNSQAKPKETKPCTTVE